MGTDLLERMQRKTTDVLRPGELYLAAQPMTVRGPQSLARWAADADLAAALPNHTARHGELTELAIADQDLPNAFLVALTPLRVLVFQRSFSGRPKELVGEHERADVTLDWFDHGDRARARTFVFGLASGEVFVGDFGINGKALDSADRFVEAF